MVITRGQPSSTVGGIPQGTSQLEYAMCDVAPVNDKP